MQSVLQDEVVVAMDGTTEGVFERKDRTICGPLLRSLKSIFKLIARARVTGWVGCERRRFAICAWHSLVRHAKLFLVPRRDVVAVPNARRRCCLTAPRRGNRSDNVPIRLGHHVR